ncbi:hypothetical protein PG996_016177 (mitochondrion) [Apiospora saccharicola]|uniref:Uncharacterized protein n=1 Tax=Apiospora saccharicola TaxID=335842 RepID=A0ABR1TDD6_9PEZI
MEVHNQLNQQLLNQLNQLNQQFNQHKDQVLDLVEFQRITFLDILKHNVLEVSMILSLVVPI